MRFASVYFFVLIILLADLVQAAAPATPVAPSIEIVIRERTFTPSVLTLTLHETVTLVIRNEDHDLHAFVPLLLFQGTNVQVRGNGAPEFNDTGFARVLIPPHGRAELSFRPRTPGQFVYICDLPGHQMRGEIVVAAASDTAPQPR
jgi:uncharacterized cupredoxin-like copper-binding protein